MCVHRLPFPLIFSPIVFHPMLADLVYAATVVGGAAIFVAAGASWGPDRPSDRGSHALGGRC